MAAPKGNQFWKLIDPLKWKSKKHFKDAEDLWNRACEYFTWVDENPWIKVDAAKGGDRFGEHVSVPTQRPYTIEGLCLYLGIDQSTLYHYEKSKGYEGYFKVTRAIKEIIRKQKFEGAAVGAFNAAIIARDLGLKEKVEEEVKVTIELSPEEREKRIKELKSKLK